MRGLQTPLRYIGVDHFKIGIRRHDAREHHVAWRAKQTVDLLRPCNCASAVMLERAVGHSFDDGVRWECEISLSSHGWSMGWSPD